MAHAVGRGPDGWLYLLVGDQTRIEAKHATLATSPIKEPVGGCVLRLSPDGKGCEIIADGFRNAYAMDWNPDGELFTFDSDNERCVSLPWYEPTRCYHVQVGGRYGWQAPQFAATWRQPPYFLDTVAPVATLGRGSPTGVVCYRHTQFPARYRGGLFLLDWTFGVVHFVALERAGSSYIGKPEVFVRSVGDNGFAPTAAAVHPLTGDLYVSIGGRGTRGAVYRIRHTAGFKARSASEAVARLQPSPRAVEWKDGVDRDLIRDAKSDDLHTRRRALDLLVRHRDRLSTEQLAEVIRANAGQSDRPLRRATARLLAPVHVRERIDLLKTLSKGHEPTTVLLASPGWEAGALVGKKSLPVALRLDAVRLLQLRLGDIGSLPVKGNVWEGYSRRRPEPEMPDETKTLLRAAFPGGDADLDRELPRTLAMIEDDDPDTLKKVAATLTARSHPTDDIHSLIVLARLKAKRTEAVTNTVADALIRLDAKIVERKLNRDTNWPLRLAELHAGLAARDAALNRAVLDHADFGRPDHMLWTRAPGFDKSKAAELFLARAKKDSTFAWNASLVALLGTLPAEKSLPVLRGLWGEVGLDDEILPVLAKHAREEDHARLLHGLISPRLALVSTSLGALEKLAAKPERRRDEGLALLRALRQLTSGKEEDALRPRLLARLAKLAGTKLTTTDDALAWYRKHFPEQAKTLASADGVDVDAWRKRLAKIDWDKADGKRGQIVYTRASCASCHSGADALGPDLAGVTGRFSRDDLFTAILQPSKDVSPRYRSTQLTTARGKSYTGIIIYDAVDSVIVQTGPAETVRLAHTQIAERRLTATSLMPTGLLDRLSDAEIADLYGYLRSLGAK
jgi:putative heme-binding domain-containing protein